MGYTNRIYPAAEVAIIAADRPDHDNERVKSGDIVNIRKPHYVIGTKEANEYLWLRITGLEENEYVQLISSGFDLDADHEFGHQILGETKRYEKRRFMIPLERLKKYYPPFDISRALDPNDKYQPFLTIDFSESGYYYFLDSVKPLDVHGLVFDKLKGVFL